MISGKISTTVKARVDTKDLPGLVRSDLREAIPILGKRTSGMQAPRFGPLGRKRRPSDAYFLTSFGSAELLFRVPTSPPACLALTGPLASSSPVPLSEPRKSQISLVLFRSEHLWAG